MAGFVRVATIEEFGEHPVKVIEANGEKVALFRLGADFVPLPAARRREADFYALSNTCSHRGGPLCEGELEGTEIVCPWHGAKFDVRTGAALSPPAPRGVRSYPVRVTGTDVELEL